MIKKYLMMDKFKKLDEESQGIFDLLSKIILEPEIQSVFRNKIGISKEGFDILVPVDKRKRERVASTIPPKKMRMPSQTRHWHTESGEGWAQTGEFYAIRDEVGFTEDQIAAISYAHAKVCKHGHNLAMAGCNFATGAENKIRIAK